MAYGLRFGLTYCVTSGQAVFLDRCQDRYFALSHDQTQILACFVRDRERKPETAFLFSANIVTSSPAPEPMAALIVAVPLTRVHAPEAFSFSLAMTARLLLLERLVAKRLRDKGLAAALGHFRAAKSARGSRGRFPSAAAICARIAGADYLRARHDHCLTRSLALGELLRAQGFSPTLVLGVSINPFAAHCWLQDEEGLLNERPDMTARYQPILSI